MKENVYLVGDVRYTQSAEKVHESPEQAVEFLVKLQKLMLEYGVIKIDVSVDPYKW